MHSSPPALTLPQIGNITPQTHARPRASVECQDHQEFVVFETALRVLRLHREVHGLRGVRESIACAEAPAHIYNAEA